MKRFFSLYEWLGPLILTPLATWLWWRISANGGIVALAVIVPVVHAYVVPGIGTNLLKVWAFESRARLGDFRVQHGFVFGSATSSLTALLFLLIAAGPSYLEGTAATALLVGLSLAAINWFYDVLAIRHGILAVYNQPWADGASAVAIAGDYVVWFFGVFGLIYGGGMREALARLGPDTAPAEVVSWAAGLLATTMLVPTLLYIVASQIRHGHSGCRPVMRRVD